LGATYYTGAIPQRDPRTRTLATRDLPKPHALLSGLSLPLCMHSVSRTACHRHSVRSRLSRLAASVARPRSLLAVSANTLLLRHMTQPRQLRHRHPSRAMIDQTLACARCIMYGAMALTVKVSWGPWRHIASMRHGYVADASDEASTRLTKSARRHSGQTAWRSPHMADQWLQHSLQV